MQIESGPPGLDARDPLLDANREWAPGYGPQGPPPTGGSPTLEVGKAATRPRFWTPGRFSGEAMATPPFGATVVGLRWPKLFQSASSRREQRHRFSSRTTSVA